MPLKLPCQVGTCPSIPSPTKNDAQVYKGGGARLISVSRSIAEAFLRLNGYDTLDYFITDQQQ